MNNYVLLYYFDKNEQTQHFEESIRKEFERHRQETNGGYKYFGFADREEPGVVDKLNGILTAMGMGRDGYYGPRDYVALYFSRDKDPDNIKRQLLIGTADMVDKGAETTGNDAHQSNIKNLLEYNFLKD